MKHIKELRKEKNMTQSQLAAAVGVGKDTVISWEKGENDLPRAMDHLKTLANVLECSTDYLIGLNDCRTQEGQFLKDKGIFSADTINFLTGPGRGVLPILEALAMSKGLAEYQEAIQNAIIAGVDREMIKGSIDNVQNKKRLERANLELTACLWSAAHISDEITKQMINSNVSDFLEKLGMEK